jgi:RNA polymerase sigma factor (sigma-70 family)
VGALVEHRTDSDDGTPDALGDTGVSVVNDVGRVAPDPADDAAREHRPDRAGPVGPSDPVAEIDPYPNRDPTVVAARLRVDFGAHFEQNYRRLVAQLYAITLDAGVAHDAVQDAYARAWRHWSTVGASHDPTAWVRGVAVRSTVRSWRTVLGRFRPRRRRPGRESGGTRTAAMLSALRRLPGPERRAIVLTYMAGSTLEEIAVIEHVSGNTVQARLSRGRRLITENLADDLPAVLGRHPGFRESRPGDSAPADSEPWPSGPRGVGSAHRSSLPAAPEEVR